VLLAYLCSSGIWVLIAHCDTPVMTVSSKACGVLEFLISLGPPAVRLNTKVCCWEQTAGGARLSAVTLQPSSPKESRNFLSLNNV